LKALNDARDTTGTAQTTVVPGVKIAQTIVPTPIYENSVYYYSITVTNLGSASASGMTVRDVLPGNATFLWWLPYGSSVSAGVLTIDVGTVAGNSTKTILVETYVPLTTAIGASITNDVSVRDAASGAVDLTTSVYTVIVAKP
jgi:hypothetical protein